MTSADLRTWRNSMSLTQAQAAAELAVSLSSYRDWEAGTSRTTGKPVQPSRMLALACAALAAGLAAT